MNPLALLLNSLNRFISKTLHRITSIVPFTSTLINALLSIIILPPSKTVLKLNNPKTLINKEMISIGMPITAIRKIETANIYSITLIISNGLI